MILAILMSSVIKMYRTDKPVSQSLIFNFIVARAGLRNVVKMFRQTWPPISGGCHFVSCKEISDST